MRQTAVAFRVLLADPNPFTRRLIRSFLFANGVRNIVATETFDALLANIHGFCPDLVLLDRDLPGLAGLDESLGMISKAAGASPGGLSVAVLGGTPTRSEALAAREAGTIGYLVKPFSEKALLHLVERARAMPLVA